MLKLDCYVCEIGSIDWIYIMVFRKCMRAMMTAAAVCRRYNLE